ncbi:MAG: SynChlorMet cassette radical SAM/SPASM protein ScmF [Bacteroidetes bacterium]|nr:SynChlorMet cassette radical SAM/SPASM protein ScmF [Bacteroidota bacterium]
MVQLSQLYLYLTEGCNLACRHCWLAPKYDARGTKYPVLDIALIQKVFKEARPLGLEAVKLTGGEPLMHPEIITILEIIKKEKLRLTIETNGLVCTKELVAKIAENKKAFVSVSLDGASADTHEWVRGVKGSFAAACNAIGYLSKAGLRPQIIFSVMRHNAVEISEIVSLGEKLGATSIKFNIIQPTARGENLHEQDETLGISELLELGKKVEFELQPTTRIHLNYDYPVAFQPLSRLSNKWSRCGIMNILGVLATGKYALCGIGEQIPELIFGKVGEDSLATIWSENPVLLKIREEIPSQLKGVCSRCLLKSKCLGSCVAQNYYRSKDLTSPFWFCELAEEAGVFPESRLI